MRKRYLITTLSVNLMGQLVHGQLTIPQDVIKITGVYHSVSLISPSSNKIVPPIDFQSGKFIGQNILAGDLRIESFEKGGWFYCGDVIMLDRNLHMNEGPTTQLFFPNIWTHAPFNHEPFEVAISGETTQLNLYFKDQWGLMHAEDIEYEITVFIETTTET